MPVQFRPIPPCLTKALKPVQRRGACARTDSPFDEKCVRSCRAVAQFCHVHFGSKPLAQTISPSSTPGGLRLIVWAKRKRKNLACNFSCVLSLVFCTGISWWFFHTCWMLHQWMSCAVAICTRAKPRQLAHENFDPTRPPYCGQEAMFLSSLCTAVLLQNSNRFLCFYPGKYSS